MMGAEMTGWAGLKSPSLALSQTLDLTKSVLIVALVLAITPSLVSEKTRKISA